MSAFNLGNEINKLVSRGFAIKFFQQDLILIVENLDLPRCGDWRYKNAQRRLDTQILIPFPPYTSHQRVGFGSSHPEYAIHTGPLYVNGQKLNHLHECGCTFGQKGWHWLCFEALDWDHRRGDGLLELMGLLEITIADRIPT
ncbi:MAG TPA: hypothetical protein PK014_05660 [Thermoanaerobaculia bacterium]|nr:hypothetical protein [Thermoanaerobaculia bacterium]HUM29582.1 hypothetical protein [Thermoanaerobaculia bacterium]HXK67233.1 hypothetical protein [Thermoanaerobaculia bacterium]